MCMSQDLDYIIVGQGVAGSMLAYQLQKRNRKFLVIDEYYEQSSSNVSTGIINPVTGRKLVKSWMVDDLLPYAQKVYQDLEQQLGIQFYHPKPIYKIFTSIKEQNEWLMKKSSADYAKYLGEVKHPEWEYVATPHGVGVMQQCVWVDLKLMLQSLRKQLMAQQQLLNEQFDVEQLQCTNDFVEYKGKKAKYIIFAEGYQGRFNPYFDYLPFSFAKGEVLKIESEDLQVDGILNKGGQIIPLGGNQFNVGSTFKWNDMEDTNTEEGKAALIKKFEKTSLADYRIISQIAGIRPTVKDRRPFLGASKKAQSVFVFNGMGTKGISLSPYFANHLIVHIETQNALNKEVDIRRFD